MYCRSSRALGALALGLAMALVWGCAFANPIVHTVRPGESVWTIAQRYGISAQDLARANGLEQARTIHPGAELAIPQPGDRSAPATALPADAAPAAAGTVTVAPSAAPAVRSAPALGAGVEPQRGTARAMAWELRAAPQRAEARPRTAARPAQALRIERAPTVRGGEDRASRICRTPAAPDAPSAASSHVGAAATVLRSPQKARSLEETSNSINAVAAPTGGESPTSAPSADGAEPASPAATDNRATAAPHEDPAAAPNRTKPSLFSSSSRLVSSSSRDQRGYGLMTALDFALKLVLVIILAYVCMLALKKFSQRRMARPSKSAGLRVVDTIGLAPNRQLHIVTLGERAFLLGSTPESVSLISDISQAQGATGLPPSPQRDDADPAFAQRLKELMKVAPAGRKAQSGSGVGLRLAQAANFIKARSNQMRPLGEIIDETLSS
jgi:flagellar biosynthetic protein FliO